MFRYCPSAHRYLYISAQQNSSVDLWIENRFLLSSFALISQFYIFIWVRNYLAVAIHLNYLEIMHYFELVCQIQTRWNVSKLVEYFKKTLASRCPVYVPMACFHTWTLSKYCDFSRIASKHTDVPLDPLQSCYLVQETIVPCGGLQKHWLLYETWFKTNLFPVAHFHSLKWNQTTGWTKFRRFCSCGRGEMGPGNQEEPELEARECGSWWRRKTTQAVRIIIVIIT